MSKRPWHKWTKEEDDFLTAFYPDHGVATTLTAFNNRFCYQISERALKHRVYDLGLRLSEKRYMEKQIANGKAFCQKPRRDVGFINPETGMIKTADGWKRLSALLNVPKGYYAVHLDNDVTNNKKENIAIIPCATSMRMTKYKFWSENSEITKTGILCCELERTIS